MLGLTQEISSLKGMVKDLVNHTSPHALPGDPRRAVRLLHAAHPESGRRGIGRRHDQDAPEATPPGTCPPARIRQAKLAEQIERLLPTSGPIVRTKTTGPHVVALIGPTGVGKTTTIAKLAANLKLREKHSVGLITLDTYRIAAVDQLKKYADIIGSPLRVVGSRRGNCATPSGR